MFEAAVVIHCHMMIVSSPVWRLVQCFIKCVLTSAAGRLAQHELMPIYLMWQSIKC